MKKEEKKVVVEALKAALAGSHCYVADSQGLTVVQVNALRSRAHAQGIVYKVVKNTLLRRALREVGDTALAALSEEPLKGFSGLLLVRGDQAPNQPAKLLKEYHEQMGLEKPVLKAAVVDGELFMGPQHLEYLHSLRSKEEVLGSVMNLLTSPARRVVSALKASHTTLASVLNALAQK